MKSLGPEEEKTAVVRTLDGCDAHCSTEGCEGLERLRVGELAQVRHHKSGENEGKTFATHAAAECTPTPSNCASHAGSRTVSRPATRPSSPAGS